MNFGNLLQFTVVPTGDPVENVVSNSERKDEILENFPYFEIPANSRGCQSPMSINVFRCAYPERISRRGRVRSMLRNFGVIVAIVGCCELGSCQSAQAQQFFGGNITFQNLRFSPQTFQGLTFRQPTFQQITVPAIQFSGIQFRSFRPPLEARNSNGRQRPYEQPSEIRFRSRERRTSSPQPAGETGFAVSERETLMANRQPFYSTGSRLQNERFQVVLRERFNSRTRQTAGVQPVRSARLPEQQQPIRSARRTSFRTVFARP